MARRQSQEAIDLGAVGGGEPKHAGWAAARWWGPLRRLTHRGKLYLLAASALASLVLLLYVYSPSEGRIAPLPVISAPLPALDVQQPDRGLDHAAKDQKEAVAAVAAAKCSELPIPAEYWQMAGVPAFVDVPQMRDIGVGSSVCVRVVVPAKALDVSSSFAPFPESPWDSILLDLVGAQTGISVPVPLQMANSTQNYHRDATHIYEADVVLRDADTYRPEGHIEFRAARWNGEDHLETQVLDPEPLTVAAGVVVSAVDSQDDRFNIGRYPQLPLCTTADADGRWVAVDKLPFDAALAPAPDNNNRVWLPYTCRLQRYTYAAFSQCLAQHYPLVHWFGDSNTRRAMKKISTFGQWCSTPADMATDLCRCSDNAEAFGGINLNAPIVPIDLNQTGGPRITMFRWGGLTTRNDPPWQDVFTQTGGIREKWGTPAAAIIGLINWDVAFSTRAFFISEAEKLAEHIATSYSDTTDIILRTGQYFCCSYDTNTTYRRKFSRLRVQYFNQYLIDAFRRRLGNKRRIFVWDVALPFERRPFAARDEEAKQCSPNHARAEIIELENQLLFNAMCNQPFD